MMSASASSQQQYIAIRDDAASLSNAERDFISQNATTTTKSTRLDGRTRSERRPVELQLTRAENLAVATVLLTGASSSSTRVTCSVSGVLGPPALDRPNEGSVAFSVDISPSASTSYRHASTASTGRATTSNSSSAASSNLPLADRHQKLTQNHLLRCLERCLLQGGALDTEALCVLPGAYCWKLSIDVVVTDAAGNLADAAVLSCMAAVRHYRKPIVEINKNNDNSNSTTGSNNNNSSSSSPAVVLIPANQREPTPLPLHHTPLSISFALFQADGDESDDTTTSTASTTTTATTTTSLLIDPTVREEHCMTGSLTIAMNVHAEICLLDFSGGCELSVEKLRECHALAASHISPLCQQLEQALQNADQVALEERLRQLQHAAAAAAAAASQQQQQQLPPLPLVDETPAPPAVPYFSSTSAAQVPTNAAADQATAELAQEEAYRKQALDYNLGHVASKVRDNKDDTSKSSRTAAGSGGASSLLTAMLQSVSCGSSSGGGGDTTATTPAAAGNVTAVEQKPSISATEMETTTVVAALPKTPSKKADDSDEEETTILLKSEFQPVSTAVNEAVVEKAVVEEGNDDDLAAAIKKKKKKKTKKK